MSLLDILDSRIFVKENSGVTFGSPRTYIEPFLDAINYSDSQEVVVKTDHEVINANEDNTENRAYGRVAVEVKMPGFDAFLESKSHYGVMGMVYALDIKPVIKIYTGQNATACTNLTVFNAENVFQQDLLGNYNEAYRKASEYYVNKRGEIEEFQKIYSELTNTEMDNDELNREIGRILRKAPFTKIGTNAIVQGVRRLDENESMYRVKAGEKCSKMNLYEAITQSFTNAFHKGQDILDRATKTVQLSKLFLN